MGLAYCIWLFDAKKFIGFVLLFAKEDRINPINWLSSRCNCCKLVKGPILDGIVVPIKHYDDSNLIL